MSVTSTVTPVVLEPAAQEFADATADPPYLFDLSLADARKVLDDAQAGEIEKPQVDETWVKVPGGPTGEVYVRIVRPPGAAGALPVVVYTHGAGWVLGNAVHGAPTRTDAARGPRAVTDCISLLERPQGFAAEAGG